MNWSELGLRQKLMLPIAVIGTLLLLISVVQISSLRSITHEYGHINEQYMPALELVLNADRDLYQAQIAERSIAMGEHSSALQKIHADNVQQVEDRLKKVLSMDVGSNNHSQTKNFLAALTLEIW
jgi:methyl-accepting chemotaxis protein